MLKILKAVLDIDHEVLVVCDDHCDSSIPVVELMQREYLNLRLVFNDYGRGVTNAIRAGMDAALGEYVLIFAADEVGPVMAIEDMLELMREGAEFVSCTRYAHGGRRLGGSLVGQVLSRIANRLFHALSGCALSDATTGIKMMRRSAYYELEPRRPPRGVGRGFRNEHESPARRSQARRSTHYFRGQAIRWHVNIPRVAPGPWSTSGGLSGAYATRKRIDRANTPVAVRATSGVPLAAQVKRS